MYKLLPQYNNQISDFSFSENISTTSTTVTSEFLGQAFFAGGSFWNLEAAFGHVDGVVKTATGYCGGTLKKPTHKEVCERLTGHTEAVEVIYDKRKISYRHLCDIFWESHDPTNKEYLNFGISTHYRSAIFYCKEEERKQAMKSKIRRQMKLNSRIVTKIMPLNSDFYLAENCHQKSYLQQKYKICESLSLRSTMHFVESNLACKLNGILAMDGKLIVEKLTDFIRTHDELTEQTKLACQEVIEGVKSNGK